MIASMSSSDSVTNTQRMVTQLNSEYEAKEVEEQATFRNFNVSPVSPKAPSTEASFHETTQLDTTNKSATIFTKRDNSRRSQSLSTEHKLSLGDSIGEGSNSSVYSVSVNNSTSFLAFKTFNKLESITDSESEYDYDESVFDEHMAVDVMSFNALNELTKFKRECLENKPELNNLVTLINQKIKQITGGNSNDEKALDNDVALQQIRDYFEDIENNLKQRTDDKTILSQYADVKTKVLTPEAQQPESGASTRSESNSSHSDYQRELFVYAAIPEHPRILKCHGGKVIDNLEGILFEDLGKSSMESTLTMLKRSFVKGAISSEAFWSCFKDLFIQTCDGLNWMHKHEWVHGDLKPDNILVRQANSNDTDEVRFHATLIDLGRAAQVGDDFLLGHELYIPDNLIKQKTESQKVKATTSLDCYALGKMLHDEYRTITGTTNREERYKKHIQKYKNIGYLQEKNFGRDEEHVQAELRSTNLISTEEIANMQEMKQLNEFDCENLAQLAQLANLLTNEESRERLSIPQALQHPFFTNHTQDIKQFNATIGRLKRIKDGLS